MTTPSPSESAIPDRRAILDLYRHTLVARKVEYASELASLDEAAAAETKSSAGDKYETAREMIRQSRNLIEHNLAEAKANLDTLDRMVAAPLGDRIGFGTLVETGLGWYLVGVSLGEETCGGVLIRSMSTVSPLALALKGRGVGESVTWRGNTLEILRIPR